MNPQGGEDRNIITGVAPKAPERPPLDPETEFLLSLPDGSFVGDGTIVAEDGDGGAGGTRRGSTDGTDVSGGDGGDAIIR